MWLLCEEEPAPMRIDRANSEPLDGIPVELLTAYEVREKCLYGGGRCKSDGIEKKTRRPSAA